VALECETWADVILQFSAIVVVSAANEARCSSTLDELIERQESRCPELGHEPFNPDPEDLEDAWR
jgi:hypothetical protein